MSNETKLTSDVVLLMKQLDDHIDKKVRGPRCSTFPLMLVLTFPCRFVLQFFSEAANVLAQLANKPISLPILSVSS